MKAPMKRTPHPNSVHGFEDLELIGAQKEQLDSGSLTTSRNLRHVRSITVCCAFPEAKQRRPRAIDFHLGQSHIKSILSPLSQVEAILAADIQASTRVHENGKSSMIASERPLAADAEAASADAEGEATLALQAADALLMQFAPPPRAGQVFLQYPPIEFFHFDTLWDLEGNRIFCNLLCCFLFFLKTALRDSLEVNICLERMYG